MNDKELTLVRIFDAPPEKLWRVWTDPELVAQWWGPNGVTNPTCEWDAKPGGKMNVVMLAGEELGELKGSRWPMSGIFKELIMPERMVFESSAIIDGKPILDNLVTVTFEEQGSQTKMTLNIKIIRITPEAEGPLAGMEMGWSQSLDKLVTFVNNS